MKTLYPDYPFKPNYLAVKGGKIHFVDEGEGSVIVMVHGNPTWSFYYRKLISVLSGYHRVVAIDHMGCGLSEKPQNYSYTLKQHIENLGALLDSLGIDRFSLILHDWGGPIGLGFALKRPEALERIVIMNSAAFRSTHIPLRISICRIPLLGEILVRLFNGFAWPAQFMAVEKTLDKTVSDAYLSPYDNWKNRVAIYSFVKDIPMEMNHPSYQQLVRIEQKLELLKESKIPFLLLWGGKDFCFNDTFYREWARRFPEAEKHYFEDGGHYLLEDKFEEIGPLVLNFFNGARAVDE